MDKKIKTLFSGKSGERLYARILDTMDEHGMAELIERGVLVGFSGGADSVFLLCFIAEYMRREANRIKVMAVHINHMIRGAEADRDEAFARTFAESLGVEFVSRSFDIPSLSRACGRGLEEVAREARYRAFADIISGRDDIFAIATAHNLTDNAETVVFNIARGSGAKGAIGIAPIKGNVIRPLLGISKDEIRKSLSDAKIEFMVDSTNDSTEYSRNYIRHEILPRLARINPRFEDAFGAFSAALRDDIDYIESYGGEILEKSRSKEVERELLLGLHPAIFARFIVDFAAHNGAGLERCHIRAIRELLPGDNFSYSVLGMDFVCERGRCYFRRKCASAESHDLSMPLGPGINELSGYSAVIILGDMADIPTSNVYKISIQADLSSAIINGSLYVRFRREGDAYCYGGMTHKLKKVFNDRGIPPSRRDKIPVICDDSGIVWVPGLGVRDDSGVGEKMTISFCTTEGGGEELYAALKEK